MQSNRFWSSESAKSLSLFSLSTLLLFFGFYSNCWRAAEQQMFLDFQRSAESLVVGRLVKSRQDGIFSASGLTGAGITNNIHQNWISPKEINHQYTTYLNGLKFDAYSPYLSQIGGQAILFSVLDLSMQLSPKKSLTLFYILTSFLSASALALIVLWFYLEFGLCTSIFVLCAMIFSESMTLFGRNLWWCIYAFYLPMIAVMYYFRYTPIHRSFAIFGVIVFVAVFTKCFINGYEYISTTLLMMLAPFVFYSVLYRLGTFRFLKGVLVSGFSSCLAIFFSLIVLSFQIGFIKEGVADGFEHVLLSFEKRTHGKLDNLPDSMKTTPIAMSLKADTIDVVTVYLKTTFLDINNYLTISNSFVSNVLLKLRYVTLVFIFFVTSVFILYLGKRCTSVMVQHKNIALIVATWFSILAPLSWFTIFKAHSFIHPHLNYVVWQMPFSLYGFAVCGVAAKIVVLYRNSLTKH